MQDVPHSQRDQRRNLARGAVALLDHAIRVCSAHAVGFQFPGPVGTWVSNPKDRTELLVTLIDNQPVASERWFPAFLLGKSLVKAGVLSHATVLPIYDAACRSLLRSCGPKDDVEVLLADLLHRLHSTRVKAILALASDCIVNGMPNGLSHTTLLLIPVCCYCCSCCCFDCSLSSVCLAVQSQVTRLLLVFFFRGGPINLFDKPCFVGTNRACVPAVSALILCVCASSTRPCEGR